MPLQEFRCKKCRKEVEVIRSLKEFDKEPEEGCDCPEGEGPEWQKFLSKPPTSNYGAGWSPYGSGKGKGNW